MPAGANSTDKAAPFFIDTTGLDFKHRAADAQSQQPELPEGDRAARRHAAAGRRRGQLHHRPDPHPAPETVAKDGVPKGTVTTFTMSSKDSVIYNPGLVRDDPPNCTNGSIYATTTAPGDKSNLIVTTSHPGTWTRDVIVYVPAGYVPGTEMPFLVYGDGPRARGRISPSSSTTSSSSARAADDRDRHRRRRPGRAGRAARQGVRHGVGRLHAVRRARGAAAGREERQREAHEEPRGPRHHGPELERRRGLHHGVVLSRALSPRAGLFADHGEPAMAVRSVAARRGVGVSQPVGGPVPGKPEPAST